MRLGNLSVGGVVSFILLCVAGVWVYDQKRSIDQPDGRLAPRMPEQGALLPEDPKLVKIGDWSVIPLQRYSVRARVLSRKRYYFDATAPISPVDFALGWGPMSDNQIVNSIKVRQSNRWYYYTGDEHDDAKGFSANTHMIPVDDTMRDKLLAVRKGHIIQAEGYLVECLQGSNPPWSSSLSRTDSGDGACEIFLVTKLDFVGADAPPPAAIVPELPKPVPGPLVESTPVVVEKAKPAPDRSSPQAFVDTMDITATSSRGAMINGEFCKAGREIKSFPGLVLTRVTGDYLYFQYGELELTRHFAP